MEELLKNLGTISLTALGTSLTVYLTVRNFIRKEATEIVNGKVKDHKYECQMPLHDKINEIEKTVARIEGHINGKSTK